jgi:hypothetical protein
MLMTVAAPFAAIEAYYAITESGDVVIKKKTARLIVSLLGSAWFVNFGAFLTLMKKEYRKTFFSTETSCQWTMSFFLMSDDDSKKKVTVGHSEAQWLKIREDVKKWVFDNWERWEEEQPEWFTERWKSRIPDDWLTRAELQRRRMISGGSRRRKSSLVDLQQVIGASASGRDRRGSATVTPEVLQAVPE